MHGPDMACEVPHEASNAAGILSCLTKRLEAVKGEEGQQMVLARSVPTPDAVRFCDCIEQRKGRLILIERSSGLSDIMLFYDPLMSHEAAAQHLAMLIRDGIGEKFGALPTRLPIFSCSQSQILRRKAWLATLPTMSATVHE